MSLNINTPATCHVLSAYCRVLSVPASRLPWYYPVDRCSTRRYWGTRQVPDKLPNQVMGTL